MTGAPYVVLPYCDRMDLAYAAADLVVARSGANTVCELTAVGLPAVYVPLPVGNGEQRLNAAAVIAAGGGLLVDDAAVTPAWVGDVVRPLALDADRLATMAAAAASVGERGGDELLADLVVAAARGGRPMTGAHPALRLHRTRAAARAARPRAPHRHRRRRHVGRRPAAARAGRPGQRVRRGRQPDAAVAARQRCPRPPRPRRRPTSPTPTPSSSRRRSATTTSSSPPPAPRDCGCCTAPRRSPRSWAASRRVAVAGANGKTTTTSMLVVALVAAGADPSFASGGEIAQLGTNAALGGGPAFVVEADESDGSFLAYRPDVAVVTNVQPDHLDFYGTRRGGRAGVRRVRRVRPRRRAPRRLPRRRRVAAPGRRGARRRPHRAHLRPRRGGRPAGRRR